MPPKPKVTRDDIVSAAFELVRTQGHENLNTRKLASALGCSTQPLLYWFASMEEIRRETYAAADGFHTGFIMEGIEHADDPLLALGVNYVRFGYEEPHLFRFLFQTDGLGAQDIGALLDGPDLGQIIGLVAQEVGISESDARTVFLSLFIAAHGYASLLANNAISFDEQIVSMALTSAYMGAIAQLEEKDHETAR